MQGSNGSEYPDQLDLTQSSDPDFQPTARGDADDIRIVRPDTGSAEAGAAAAEEDAVVIEEEKEGKETGWNVKVSMRVSWRRRGRDGGTGTGADGPLPTADALIAPSIVFGGCMSTGATPGTTLLATAIFVAISIGTHLTGRGRQS